MTLKQAIAVMEDWAQNYEEESRMLRNAAKRDEADREACLFLAPTYEEWALAIRTIIEKAKTNA